MSGVAAGLASIGYLLLVYPPIAVIRNPSIPYVDFIGTRPVLVAAGLMATLGVTLLGAAALRSRTYPAWIGMACLVSPVVFLAIALTDGPALLSFALTPGTARASSACVTQLESERVTMSKILVAALAAVLLTSATARAQSTATPPTPSAATTTTLGPGPDLQGLWDFTMRVGDRTSPGFFALGPVEQGWAGSLTLYLTNTLAIRSLTVEGDSVRMVVASREGDVIFHGRLTDNARTMQGIVDYHGGARLPMTATRRAIPVAPR